MARRIFPDLLFVRQPVSLLSTAILLAVVSLPPVSAAQRVDPSTNLRCDIEFAKLGNEGRLTERTELIASFLHQKYATVRENLKFGVTENSITGPLNGITKDKSFVTSITNNHKGLTVEMLQASVPTSKA